MIDKVDVALVKKSFESLDMRMVNFAHATKRDDLLSKIDAKDALKDGAAVNDAKYQIDGQAKTSGVILEHYYNILYKKEKIH